MNNKIEEIIASWKNKHEDNVSVYSNERVAEIATNCVSLTETWFNRVGNVEKLSLEVILFDKDNVNCQSLYGVSTDNVAETIFNILINESNKFSKIEVNYFFFDEGKKVSGLLGELEIS